jgi:hypothetical protein
MEFDLLETECHNTPKCAWDKSLNTGIVSRNLKKRSISYDVDVVAFPPGYYKRKPARRIRCLAQMLGLVRVPLVAGDKVHTV